MQSQSINLNTSPNTLPHVQGVLVLEAGGEMFSALMPPLDVSEGEVEDIEAVDIEENLTLEPREEMPPVDQITVVLGGATEFDGTTKKQDHELLLEENSEISTQIPLKKEQTNAPLPTLVAGHGAPEAADNSMVQEFSLRAEMHLDSPDLLKPASVSIDENSISQITRADTQFKERPLVAANAHLQHKDNVAAQVTQGVIKFLHSSDSSSELRLNPYELGNLRFEMSMNDDHLHIRLVVERPETLELIKKNLEYLTAELKQSGFGQATLDFGEWSEKHDPQAGYQHVYHGQILSTEAEQALNDVTPMAIPGRLNIRR